MFFIYLFIEIICIPSLWYSYVYQKRVIINHRIVTPCNCEWPGPFFWKDKKHFPAKVLGWRLPEGVWVPSQARDKNGGPALIECHSKLIIIISWLIIIEYTWLENIDCEWSGQITTTNYNDRSLESWSILGKSCPNVLNSGCWIYLVSVPRTVI